MPTDLTNKSALDIAIASSPEKPYAWQAVSYLLWDGNRDAVTRDKRLLHSFREGTGGDSLLCTRKPGKKRIRTFVQVIGRRGGKDSTDAVIALREAFNTAHDAKIGQGESYYIFLIAPNRDLCRTMLSFVTGRLDYAGHTYDRTESEIRIHGRPCVIRVTTADEVSARGKSAALAIFIESQHLPSDEDASGVDTEVLASVNGALLNLEGRLILQGTPWTKAGVLFDYFAKHLGKVDGDVLVTHLNTWTATDGKFTEAQCRAAITDPKTFNREFGAQFSETSDHAAFDRKDILAALGNHHNDAPRIPGVDYAVTIDFATRHDWCVVAVGHRMMLDQATMPDGTGRAPLDVLVVDSIRMWKAEKGQTLLVELIIQEIVAICRRYNCTSITRDIASGDALDAALRAFDIVGVEASSAPSKQMARYANLQTKFKQKTIRLPAADCKEIKEAIAQLYAVEEKLHSGGRISYQAPTGKHDDVPDALSLLAGGEATVKLMPEGMHARTDTFWSPSNQHLQVKTTYWIERMYGGQIVAVPCEPPYGSYDGIVAALERRTAGYVSASDTAQLEGVDPADYAGVNIPVCPTNPINPDPMNAPGVRFARSMGAMQSGGTGKMDRSGPRDASHGRAQPQAGSPQRDGSNDSWVRGRSNGGVSDMGKCRDGQPSAVRVPQAPPMNARELHASMVAAWRR